ncbi:carbohydrate-binding module family 5 protein [Botryobasidium botryosum FD-172 SS1]|uniref:chitinase n=1 Tax=Botryobasidium botryosum (strain FD-172 SS1) TaxID=930990 RepID=A0A067M4C9_BOTB1|nr:carbohydrate-binding module family 5 protein [Botryobasidium botryosum FD-172 SS1]
MVNSHSIFILALLGLAANATEVMHRPENYLSKLQPNQPVSNAPAHNVTEQLLETHTNGKGKVNGAYFTNWYASGIYGRAYFPQQIPASKLTHILYSFADTNPTTGQVTLTDTFSDQEKHYDGDSWSESGSNVYGNFKQLYLLKKANRNLKVLLSIGGWTYSQAGHFNFVTNAGARTTFVNSAITLMEDNGLDGIDIDFEYPTAAQASAFTALLSELRTALDSHAAKKGETNPYQISAAVSAGPKNYQVLDIAGMDKSLTNWNLMAYDYAGSWDTVADDQANLYPGTTTGFDTDTAVKYYLTHGATASKLNLGLPLYGRAFENTTGIEKPFNGVGPGTWEAGVYDYKVLPLPGASVSENSTLGASYSYDAGKKKLVSYDTPNIIAQKVAYANSKGLGGTFFWELSGDKTDGDSLVGKAQSTLDGLDTTQNHLSYPFSKYDNIKNGMDSNSTGAQAPTPTNPPSTGGKCGGVSAWSSSAVYTGGLSVTYGGHLWTAKWWTQNEAPGASSAWEDKGAC